MKSTPVFLNLGGTLLAVCLVSLQVHGGTQLITFDDLSTTNSLEIYNGSSYYYSALPTNYGGLTWNNFSVTAGVIDTNSGYQPAVISPRNVAFNLNGSSATISNSSPFNLLSGYFTAAWNDNLKLEAKGYVGNALVFSQTNTLSAVAPTLLTLNFLGVNKVVFRAFGGTPHHGYSYSDPPYSGGTWFAVDDLTFCETSVGTVSPAQPTYGNCPQKLSGKDSLVVVTHGANPDLTWLHAMTNSIGNYLAANGLSNWHVCGYEWAEKARVPFFGLNYERVLYNGEQEGRNLGNSIATQGWSHVHLIGHSAGSALIQAASESVKSGASNTVVHTTF